LNKLRKSEAESAFYYIGPKEIHTPAAGRRTDKRGFVNTNYSRQYPERVQHTCFYSRLGLHEGLVPDIAYKDIFMRMHGDEIGAKSNTGYLSFEGAMVADII